MDDAHEVEDGSRWSRNLHSDGLLWEEDYRVASMFCRERSIQFGKSAAVRYAISIVNALESCR